MTAAQLQTIKAYFNVVLPYCDKAKLNDLIANLGYDATEVTADLCVKAWQEYGVKFTQPFGKLATVAINSTKYAKMKQYLMQDAKTRTYTQLSRADGKNKTAKKNQLTDEQINEYTLSYIGVATDLLKQGYEFADLFVNKDYRDNMAKSQQQAAENEKLKLQTQAQMAQNEATKKWLVPTIIGVSALLIVIVLVVVLTRKK